MLEFDSLWEESEWLLSNGSIDFVDWCEHERKYDVNIII